MKIETRTRGCFVAELIITDTNATICSDVASGNKVDQSIIEQLITAANEFSRFNDARDVDFVFSIAEAFLNDYERDVLVQMLTAKK